MRGKLVYQYENLNKTGDNFNARWHPVKATATLDSGGMLKSRASTTRRRRGMSPSFRRSKITRFA